MVSVLGRDFNAEMVCGEPINGVNDWSPIAAGGADGHHFVEVQTMRWAHTGRISLGIRIETEYL
jgi:hypothetical protein